MHLLTYAVVAIGLIVVYCLSFISSKSRKSQFRTINDLPGPKLVPLIGRVHDLPLSYTWLKFKEWADVYGPLYRTKQLSVNLLVISDEKIAEELLVKNAKTYSDRPVVQSIVDSKSTDGSMEYLPLMGRNRMF
jgi:hypothetical protein